MEVVNDIQESFDEEEIVREALKKYCRTEKVNERAIQDWERHVGTLATECRVGTNGFRWSETKKLNDNFYTKLVEILILAKEEVRDAASSETHASMVDFLLH